MKRAKLILLSEPIVVTDEEIKEGGKFLTRDGNIFEYKNGYTPSDTNCGIEGCKKVINKPIDYNGIDFGIVDVEKLALEKYPLVEGFKNISKDIDNEYRRDGFIESFKASQQLNEKKFTLDDLRDAFESGECYGKTWSEFYNTDSVSRAEAERTSDFNDFIRELSLPKTFEVEIEEIDTHIKILKKL